MGDIRILPANEAKPTRRKGVSLCRKALAEIGKKFGSGLKSFFGKIHGRRKTAVHVAAQEGVDPRTVENWFGSGAMPIRRLLGMISKYGEPFVSHVINPIAEGGDDPSHIGTLARLALREDAIDAQIAAQHADIAAGHACSPDVRGVRGVLGGVVAAVRAPLIAKLHRRQSARALRGRA